MIMTVSMARIDKSFSWWLAVNKIEGVVSKFDADRGIFGIILSVCLMSDRTMKNISGHGATDASLRYS